MGRLFQFKVENEATRLFDKIQEIVEQYGAKIIDENILSWLGDDKKGFTIKLIIKKKKE